MHLKDLAGNYLWKESDKTIFSKPVQVVDSMPSIGKGQKVIAFGDFSNYWLVQRFPLTIRTLKEKFAMRGQVGYLGCEYLDGKLIRKDASRYFRWQQTKQLGLWKYCSPYGRRIAHGNRKT